MQDVREPVEFPPKPLPHDRVDGVESLARTVERYNLADYMLLIQHPWRLIWVNLLSGIARGLGAAIGFSVLSGLLLYMLQELIASHLPIISNVVADVVHMVRLDLKMRP